MTIKPKRLCFAIASLLLFSLQSFAEDAAKNVDAKPDLKSVEEPVLIEGVFESLNSVELLADSKQIEAYVIKRILPHGAPVKRGATVVWFDSDEIDKRIAKAEVDLALASLALAESEFAFEKFIEQQALDRKTAEVNRKDARQAYDNFVNIDREQQIAAAEFQLASAEHSLEYSQEELDQLQKMYDEDDLTEESEEIVLKRTRRDVESSKYFLEIAKERAKRTLEQAIPNQQVKQESTLATAEIEFAKAIRALSDSRMKKELELKRQKSDFEKLQSDFKELQSERRKLVLTSPIDGVVYHGELTRGSLSDKPSDLSTGSKVTAKQVIATVVQPERLQIRVDLTEAQRAKLNVSDSGIATATAFPNTEIPVFIKSISAFPLSNNKLDCVIAIKGGVKEPAIVPGMSCKVKFSPPNKEEMKNKSPSDKKPKALE